MAVFVDTSALLSLADPGELRHEAATTVWRELLGSAEVLITTNYVLLETAALLQRRIGIPPVRALQADVVPVFRVEWIDFALHQAGMVAVLAAGRRQLSLVDCVSFEVMSRLGLSRAFAFDSDFEVQGFSCLPNP